MAMGVAGLGRGVAAGVAGRGVAMGVAGEGVVAGVAGRGGFGEGRGCGCGREGGEWPWAQPASCAASMHVLSPGPGFLV